MTRPIIWATATFAGLAMASSFAGDRLSRIATTAPTQADPVVASLPPPVAPAPRGLPSGAVIVHGDRRGHFHLEASIDGRHLPVLVDTGATYVALTSDDAAAAGIRPFPSDFTVRMSTANGTTTAAPVRLREVRVGDITLRDVDAIVARPGQLATSLLGMSFLRRLRSFDIEADRLTLRG